LDQIEFKDIKMLPNPWTVAESSQLNIYPIFVNSTKISVMLTLTFQADVSGDLLWTVYQYTPSQTLGTFPYGAAIVEVNLGQTVTTVFDVPSTGRIYGVPGPHFGAPSVLTYEVEEILWGRG